MSNILDTLDIYTQNKIYGYVYEGVMIELYERFSVLRIFNQCSMYNLPDDEYRLFVKLLLEGESENNLYNAYKKHHRVLKDLQEYFDKLEMYKSNYDDVVRNIEQISTSMSLSYDYHYHPIIWYLDNVEYEERNRHIYRAFFRQLIIEGETPF